MEDKHLDPLRRQRPDQRQPVYRDKISHHTKELNRMSTRRQEFKKKKKKKKNVIATDLQYSSPYPIGLYNVRDSTYRKGRL